MVIARQYVPKTIHQPILKFQEIMKLISINFPISKNERMNNEIVFYTTVQKSAVFFQVKLL